MDPRWSRDYARTNMKGHTHAIDVASALPPQGDDETIEIRILRPHETYWRNPSACAPDSVDRAAELDDTHAL